MRRLIQLALLLLVPSLAWAQPSPAVKRQLTVAGDSLGNALDRARSSRECRRAVGRPLDAAVDRIDELRKEPSAEEISALKVELGNQAMTAGRSGCAVGVTDSIQRAIEALEDARAGLWQRRDHGDRRDRRHEEDEESNRPPQQPQPQETGFVQVSQIKVTPNSVFDGEPAVRLSLPEVHISEMQGRTVYLGARYRSYEGDWSQWITTQLWTVPTDDFTWRNAFNHFLRYSTLAEDDFSQGRFLTRVSVFDGSGRELAFRDTGFVVRLPNLPVRPPPVLQPPPLPPQVTVQPGQPPPPVAPGPPMPPPPPGRPAYRDCGTGNDPGCLMARGGSSPMDAPTYQGFITSLRSNGNELSRQQICTSILANNFLTALQLGTVLDLFPNELIRLEVAKRAAPRVVNPQHALGYAAKWRNSMLAQQYTQVMANSR